MEEIGGGQGACPQRAKATFRVGQNVCIRKEKMRFAKAAEQNFSPEFFRVAIVIDKREQVVYELEDVNGTPMDGQVYREKCNPARITDRTAYKIYQILINRVTRYIRENLVRWRVYSQDFDSWVPAASVKNI